MMSSCSFLDLRGTTTEHEVDPEEWSFRVTPDPIHVLCRTTLFTRSELQFLYRGFKQVCVFLFVGKT